MRLLSLGPGGTGCKEGSAAGSSIRNRWGEAMILEVPSLSRKTRLGWDNLLISNLYYGCREFDAKNGLGGEWLAPEVSFYLDYSAAGSSAGSSSVSPSWRIISRARSASS